MSASKVAKVTAGLAAALSLWLTASACELGDGACLRMSDCDVGYSCVDGTCRSETSDAPKVEPAPIDAAATPSPPPSSSTTPSSSPDAATIDAASPDAETTDAGWDDDGGSTDASSDA